MLRVLICDKSPVVSTGLKALLEQEPDLEVIDTTDSALHALVLTRDARPDVVVTGLELLSLSGVDLVRQLTDLGPGRSPRVVVYAMNDADDVVADVLHAGADGLLVKNAHRGELATAIRAVASGEAALAPSVARRLVEWFRRRDNPPDVALSRVVATLTRREQEVLLLLARGMQPEEIAEKLFIGVTTVRTHIYRLRNKLSLKDRAQLVSFAFRAGLMQTDLAGDGHPDGARAAPRQWSHAGDARARAGQPVRLGASAVRLRRDRPRSPTPRRGSARTRRDP